jgi:4-diphosphocytidyl-2-C-methyl-D-erythritol kinase
VSRTATDAVRLIAPAKVNLCLHVGPLGPDGFHPLESLVAFADDGDVLEVVEADAPSFRVTGPFAADLGAGENLVERALAVFGAQVDLPSLHITLDKRLPVAAGLGGGSMDGAVLLAHLRDAYAPRMPDDDLAAMARTLGADGPMGLYRKALIARGHGDEIKPLAGFPRLFALIVNPRVPCSTGPVYAAFDRSETRRDWRFGAPEPAALKSAEALIAWLAAQRNDLQAPAMALQPAIAEVMDALAGAPLVRMSGSGASVFGLYVSEADRDRACRQINHGAPHWWCLKTQLS